MSYARAFHTIAICGLLFSLLRGSQVIQDRKVRSETLVLPETEEHLDNKESRDRKAKRYVWLTSGILRLPSATFWNWKHRAKNEISICPVYMKSSIFPTVFHQSCRGYSQISYKSDIWLYPPQDWWRTVNEMSNFMYTEHIGNLIFHPKTRSSPTLCLKH